MFTVFRFFSGLGSWAFLVITPVYCSELAQPQYRGLMVGMNGVMIGLGYSIASYIGLGFFFSTNATAQWRAPLGLAPFFPILMFIVLFFIPESPRYLLMHNRTDEAWKVVSKLHATPGDPQQEFARSEFYQMQKQSDADREMDTSWKMIFTRPSYRKRMLIGMGFAFFGQSTGAFVVNNYATVIYSSMGFGAKDQLILACGWISVSIFGNLGGALVVDRLGRKPLMLWAFIGCCCCLTLEAAMVARYAAEGTNKVGLGFALFASYSFSVFYTPGIDCNNAIFLGELFPNHIRAKGVTLCLVVYACIDLVYLQVAPTAFERVGWKFYLLFIILCAIGAVWAWLFVPETKGVPLEEMAAIFGDPEDVVIYLREVHVDHTNNELVVEPHADDEKASIQRVEESHVHNQPQGAGTLEA
ncbi:general substrate transporter [Exophiala viscosa]|nr:general substrate transporter [Exophiala viscosa]